MYTNNAAGFLDGKMGSLSAGKLTYAGWRGKKTTPRNFPQETAQPTSSNFLNTRGGVGGLGVLPDEPSWTAVNCGNAVEWFEFIVQNANAMKTNSGVRVYASAFFEWVYAEGVKAKNSKQFKDLGNNEFSFCLCPGVMTAKFGKSGTSLFQSNGQDWQEMEIALSPQGSVASGRIPRIYGVRKWASQNEYANNPGWWDSDSLDTINSHYGLFSVAPVQVYNWMTSCTKTGPSIGTTSCPAPCVLDDNGNCMKPCNGRVVRCSDPCEPVPPPIPPTPPTPPATTVPDTGGCCENCEATAKQGSTQFYLSKNKTDQSIPVMVRGKTIECTPKNPDKQYQWDCNQVMTQIQSYLGNSPNSTAGIGYLGVLPGAIGSGKTTAGQIATATANTGCPCDCKETDGQVQMYVNTTKTGEGDIPFTLPYTTVDCNSKGGLNPDGTPKDKISNLKINCDDIKNAIAQQGYSMSGLGDCGCGNCHPGMGSLSNGQVTAYVLGAGVFSLALFYVFGNKIKGL